MKPRERGGGDRLIRSLLWVAFPLIVFLIRCVFPGFPMVLASQPSVEIPCPPLSEGRELQQTFFFPDRPVSGIALIPGTYQRRNTGLINISLLSRSSPSDHRNITIDTRRLTDNTWFLSQIRPPLNHPLNSKGIIRIRALESPPGSEITFWRSETDRYPGGMLTLDGIPIRGDLAFKLFSRIRGLEIAQRFADVYSRYIPLPRRLLLLIIGTLFGALTVLIWRAFFFMIDGTERK